MKLKLFFLCALIATASACTTDETSDKKPFAKVSTKETENLTATSAILAASYKDASQTPDFIGFEWGTASNRLNKDVKSNYPISEKSGDFTASIEGLAPNTTYYYRAYITVIVSGFYKYAYGEIMSFTTADGVIPPEETEVTTEDAEQVTSSSAIIAASFRNAEETPTYTGFEWGLDADNLTEDLHSKTSLSGTSGEFEGNLSGLSSGTTYYYRGYIAVLVNNNYKMVYGTVKSFKTSASTDPVTEGREAGWFELPRMDYNLTPGDYMVHKTNPNLYYAYHIADVGTRNYTVCYSGEYHCPVWVAAPRHPIYSAKKTSRSNNYRKDPKIPEEVQQASTSGSTSGYNRGHMLGSAERLGSKELNNQVFYITNIAPQNDSWFNTGGGGWNILEDYIDDFECSDTLCVVIGAYFEDFTDGYGNTATKKKAAFMGSEVQIPTAFYYALMRTKTGNTGKSLKKCSTNNIQCAAFIRAHASGNKGQQVTYKEMISIRELEELTGFNYFPNIPHAPKDSYLASDWGF
jgi:DNA/RNA endonuclease G (NUC1)